MVPLFRKRERQEIVSRSERLADQACYLDSIAPNTRRAMQGALDHYARYDLDILAISDEELQYFVLFCIEEELSVNTIKTRVAMLRKYALDGLGIDIPFKGSLHRLELTAYQKRLARAGEKRGNGQASGLSDIDVLSLVRVIEDDFKGKRDKALLLFSFITAGRVSETINFRVSDIDWKRETIHLGHNKTDQDGEGTEKHLPSFVLEALEEWIMAAGLFGDDLIFRSMDRHGNIRDRISAQAINGIIKQYFGDGYSSHSFRVGFIETAIERGITEAAVMLTTKHKTSRMVAHYGRKANQKKSAAAQLWG